MKLEMDENNYINTYRQIQFSEKLNDVYSSASVRRKCLAVAYQTANESEDNETSCHILKEKLSEYCRIVDNQGNQTVNNYAEPVLALLGHSKNDSHKQWKSGLTSDMVLKYLKPLPCQKTPRDDCSSTQITRENIQLLIRNKQNYRYHEKLAKASDEMVNNSQIKRSTLVSKNEFRNKTLVTGNSFERHSPNLSTPSTSNFAKTNQPPNQRRPNEVEGTRDGGKVPFKTARDQLIIQNQKKFGSGRGGGEGGEGCRGSSGDPNLNYGAGKRTLGAARKGVLGKFKPPVKPENSEEASEESCEQGEEDDLLKHIDQKMVELITSEIMDTKQTVTWDDIAGLDFVKATIQEIVVWPMLRPDIFTGLRRPSKGILLFGPPGTGKTLIGKCIASQSHSTFFSISASSLTSKWIGDGEKMVRALFSVARVRQPSVVFIDEIDSLLSQRNEQEHESSRRIKTEFLVQLDGAATGEEDRILIIGATNRPQELDEAARRRLVKRLYIPLPDLSARKQLISNLLSNEKHSLTDSECEEIAHLTEGYSGADMKNLCQEASLGPIRSIPMSHIQQIQSENVRPVNVEDFKKSLNRVKSSVSETDLDLYVKWDKQFGCSSAY